MSRKVTDAATKALRINEIRGSTYVDPCLLNATCGNDGRSIATDPDDVGHSRHSHDHVLLSSPTEYELHVFDSVKVRAKGH